MAWVAVDLGFLSGGSFSTALATTPDDDALVIVGQGDTGSSSFESHGFWWTEATGMVDLGLLAGGTFSIATGVSNDGTKVCGQADDASGFPQPVLWTMDIDGTILSMTALPLLGTGDQGVAFGVSYDGSTVVGFSDTAPYPTPNVNPFSYTSGPSSVDLGLLAGNLVGIGTCCTADGTTVYGGTNNTTDAPWTAAGAVVTAIPLFAGEVSGTVLACAATGTAATGFSATIPGGDQHGFIWKLAGGTSLIGAFGGANFSVGYGMSTLGSFIVGDSATTGNHRAFLWDVTDAAGDFEELFPLAGGVDAIARGIAGVDINNDIIIVGSCRVAGAQHAVYWFMETPTAGTTVADLFFTATGAFVDLNDEANRRKFISLDGGAQNLGLSGELPFGVTPPVFLSRNGLPSTFAANAGRGGEFFISGGDLEAGDTDPPGTTTFTSVFVPPSDGNGVLGDYRNGNLYAFNPATLTDNGSRRRWVRRWRALPQSGILAVKFSWLAITMQTGSGMAPGANPQLVLRWSDDGGTVWSDERIIPVGPLGATTFTVKANRLGSTRRFSGSDRVFELSSTDAFVVSILSADVETA